MGATVPKSGGNCNKKWGIRDKQLVKKWGGGNRAKKFKLSEPKFKHYK